MASETKSKHYTLKKHFVGLPQEDDFGFVEEAITPLADGGNISPKGTFLDLKKS